VKWASVALGWFAALIIPGWSAESSAAQAAAGPSISPWMVTAASDIRYFTWQSDHGFPTRASGQNGGHGEELYLPFAAQAVGRLGNPDFGLELLARGGWVWARQSSGVLSGKVATSTDTQTSATLTYYGWRGLQPFVSLATNLPTGRASLPGLAANARMDPDLVDIATFGEGFNIGPTIGVTAPITPTLVATLSAGYTWRDPFSRENSLDATDPNVQSAVRVNPGDVLALTGVLAYKIGAWVVSLNGSVSLETKTTENGEALYQPGKRYVAGATVTYAWPDTGVTTLTAAASHSDRNKVLFSGASALVTETMNTNSNLYRVGLDHLYPVVKDRLYVGPLGTFLLRDHNGYSPGTLQFVPEKQRWTVGARMRYASAPNVVWNARMEHVWTREDDDPAPGGQRFSILANAFIPGSAVPVVSSTGWQFVVGINARF
jgi:hypothetical protein